MADSAVGGEGSRRSCVEAVEASMALGFDNVNLGADLHCCQLSCEECDSKVLTMLKDAMSYCL